MSALANPELERKIINALANTAAVNPDEARGMLELTRLQAEDFSVQAIADVFRVATDFLGRNVPLELFAIEAALAGSEAVKKAGARQFLAPLLMAPDAFGEIIHEHARIVRELSIRRRGMEMLRRAASQLQNPARAVPEAISELSEALNLLLNKNPSLSTSEGQVFRLGEMLDAAQAGRRELCVPTGIDVLDAEIGGLLAGRLTLLGALPGVGKSALLATIIRNVANRGTKVGFFSLEDEQIWLSQRLFAIESGVPLFLLCMKPLNTHQRELVEDAAERVYKTLKNVVTDDRPALSPSDVAESAKDMILNFGCRLLVVDHLGEMRMDRKNERYDLEIADALAILRDVAKKYDVPIIVASHVRRRTGMTIADAPSLTDFANSSAPERMARLAIGLSKVSDDLLRVSILKQTNGKSGQEIGISIAQHAAMIDSLKSPSLPDPQ